MATHLDYDIDKKVIYITTAPTDGVLTLDVKVDIYSDIKEDWKTNSTLNKLKFPFRPTGGDVIIPGVKEKSPFYFLIEGWRVRPYEANHTLYLENGYLSVDGGGEPWLTTLGAYTVNIRDSIPADAFSLPADATQYSEVGDYVWSQTISGYEEGSAGEALNNISAGASPSQIADAVWDEVLVDHTLSGTFGVKSQNLVPSENIDDYKADSVNINYSGIADAVWDENTGEHTTAGTYGHEVATKADIAASTSTVHTSPYSATTWNGSPSGNWINVFSRDDTYYTINEDSGSGILVDFAFNLPDDNRAGNIELFGRYTGQPSTSHWIDLYIWNVEVGNWEILKEEFLPGGNTSDALYSHEYYERHINKDSNNRVEIRLSHSSAVFNNAHYLYIDYLAVSSIDIITAADIADAVWDETISGHETAGTFGAKNQNVVPSENIEDYKATSVDVSMSGIADAVWDENLSDHNIVGSFGSKNQNLVPSENIDDYKATSVDVSTSGIADAVWDEQRADHNTVGTFGEKNQLGVPSENLEDYKATSVDVSMSGIADAVWDEQMSAHMVAGTTGEALTYIMGLSKNNFKITSQIYDAGGRLTSATISIYPTATDTNNNTNVIATFTSTATYDANGACTEFKVIKN